MARHPRTLTLETFKGINNKTPPDRTPDGYYKELINLDIDPANNLQKRNGYTLVEAGDFHSLWSDRFNCYAVKDNNLVEVDKCVYSTRVLLTDIGPHPVSFERVDNTVYFVSKAKAGKIINGEVYPWGIEKPLYSPTVVTSTGSLGKGSYSVTWTYQYEDGQESGSPNPSFIEIPENSSIDIQNFPTPTDPNIKYINIYGTHQNGMDLYRIAQLPITQTSFNISSTLYAEKILRTTNLYPAPLGSIVKWFQGRLYIADGNILWYSDPLEYDLFNYASNYFYFERDITAACPVEGGIWISDEDKTYYLQGKDPVDMKRVEKEPVSILRGSDVKIHGDLVSIDNTPVGYKWLVTTERGFHVLYNDGLIINLTEKNIAFPKAYSSAAGMFEEKGVSKYISLLEERKPASNARVGDTVTATIVRNGVEVPN